MALQLPSVNFDGASPSGRHHHENASMHSGAAGAIGILRLHLSRAPRTTNSTQDDSLALICRQVALTEYLQKSAKIENPRRVPLSGTLFRIKRRIELGLLPQTPVR